MYSMLRNAEKMAVAEYDEAPEDWPQPDQPIANDWFEKYYLPFFNTANVEHRNKIQKDSYIIRNMSGKIADTQSGGRMFTKFSDGSCITHFVNGQFYFLVYDVNCSSPPNVLGKDVWDIAEFRWSAKLYNGGWIDKRETIPQMYNYTPAKRSDFVENCKIQTHMGGQPTTCFAVFVADGFKFSKDLHW